MRRSIKRHFVIITSLIAVAILLQACGKEISPEPSCNFVQNSKMQRVSWKDEVVKMYIHKSVPIEAHNLIRSSANEWNHQLGYNAISIETVVGGNGTPSKDGYNIIYWMRSWDENKKTEQARTTIYWKGSQIYEADIRINAKYHSFSYSSEVEPQKVDFKSLMVHEMGHVLGLAHVEPQTQSVMHAYLQHGKHSINHRVDL